MQGDCWPTIKRDRSPTKRHVVLRRLRHDIIKFTEFDVFWVGATFFYDLCFGPFQDNITTWQHVIYFITSFFIRQVPASHFARAMATTTAPSRVNTSSAEVHSKSSWIFGAGSIHFKIPLLGGGSKLCKLGLPKIIPCRWLLWWGRGAHRGPLADQWKQFEIVPPEGWLNNNHIRIY